MPASRVDWPTCSTRSTSGLEALTLPAITESPCALAMGRLSPVSSDSLLALRPSSTTPSAEWFRRA
ncbi:Uncharacterised protein [Chromobacterium violaceum]|uniref:Uncharacterized protein n=1 Tax=Chromobacterium violaceum TaxID=536 RepID=A0A3S4J092_CHRVL|nr:Uncharacterised protein [Chromobacterium violaceum]